MYIDNQEVFTKSVSFLRKQGKKSIKDDFLGEKCAYRGRSGTKCAIGCLIPDDMYYNAMENMGRIDALIKGSYPIRTLFSNVSIDLLRSLQNIHDTIPIESWEYYWKNLASFYSLENID